MNAWATTDGRQLRQPADFMVPTVSFLISTRKHSPQFFFVHSFRVLMPRQMYYIIKDPIMEVINMKRREREQEQGKTGAGAKYTKARWERMAKSIAFTIGLPVAIDLYMQARDFEREKLGWKWSRKFKAKDRHGRLREYEHVVALNYILNMPLKWWHRVTSRDPLARNQTASGIENLIRWEVHPLWRILLWDVRDNRKSFGSGDYIWDPTLDPSNPKDMAKILAAITKYTYGESFRFYGKVMDAVESGTMTDKELEDQKRILKEASSTSERVIFNVFGYDYLRMTIEERRSVKLKQLDKEFMSRGFDIAKKYEGKDLDKAKSRLKSWFTISRDWITKEMK